VEDHAVTVPILAGRPADQRHVAADQGQEGGLLLPFVGTDVPGWAEGACVAVGVVVGGGGAAAPGVTRRRRTQQMVIAASRVHEGRLAAQAVRDGVGAAAGEVRLVIPQQRVVDDGLAGGGRRA
jgi:hypothetical protein